MTRTLMLFAKAPMLGKVKTRLAASGGKGNALRIYHQAVSHMLAELSQVSADRKIIYVAPRMHPWLNAQARQWGWEMRVQRPGDLGQKMHAALSRELKCSDQAVIVGADCVGLNAGQIEAAFGALSQYPLVFVPSDDGGYVLVGSTKSRFDVFRHIPWGSGYVWHRTQRRLERMKIKYHVAGQAWDLDHWEDLKRFKANAS